MDFLKEYPQEIVLSTSLPSSKVDGEWVQNIIKIFIGTSVGYSNRQDVERLYGKMNPNIHVLADVSSQDLTSGGAERMAKEYVAKLPVSQALKCQSGLMNDSLRHTDIVSFSFFFPTNRKWWQFWKSNLPDRSSRNESSSEKSVVHSDPKSFTGKSRKCLNCGESFPEGRLECMACGSKRFIWE